MERKTECEIVQDLLYGYVDKVLNPESKKLVDKHLIECKECQKKLEEINNDSKEENSEIKQIDYLKKIRRKNRIKTILTVIGIFICILLIIFLRKFIIINSIYGTAQKTINNNNYYKEISQPIYNGEVGKETEHSLINKIYYKDGKYKEILEIYNETELTYAVTTYRTLNSDENIVIHENKVYIQKDEMLRENNTEQSFLVSPLIQNSTMRDKLIMALFNSIEIENEYNGKAYVLKDLRDDWIEYVFDKETGLPIGITNSKRLKKIPGSTIVGEMEPRKSNFGYKFGIVTDEDVAVPDLKEYEVQYVTDTE